MESLERRAVSLGALLVGAGIVGTSACAHAQRGGDDVGRLSNIEKIRWLFASINEGRQQEAVGALAAPHFVRHDLTGALPDLTGQEGALQFLMGVREAIPDLRLEISDIMAAEDKVIVRFIAVGTHRGVLFGHGATGRAVQINNINIYRFEDGLVAETWQLADGFGLLRQVGALP